MSLISLLITWVILWHEWGLTMVVFSFLFDDPHISKTLENFATGSMLLVTGMCIAAAVLALIGYRKEGHILMWALLPIPFIVIVFFVLFKFILK